MTSKKMVPSSYCLNNRGVLDVKSLNLDVYCGKIYIEFHVAYFTGATTTAVKAEGTTTTAAKAEGTTTPASTTKGMFIHFRAEIMCLETKVAFDCKNEIVKNDLYEINSIT